MKSDSINEWYPLWPQKKPYNPKSAFDDRSLPGNPNPLTAEKEENLVKKAEPLIKASLDKLR
jgi:hypothetical protein